MADRAGDARVTARENRDATRVTPLEPGSEMWQIVLTPVRIQRADAVRAKLAELDLQERDIADAVGWARKPVGKHGQ
jgi:hypothetical protein